MRCVIIDDEPAARDVLQKYISDTPELELTGVCRDALEGRQLLKEKEVDLIFLDVEMPRLSGIDFLKSLTVNPKVILTTAYSEYALEGYELDVIDYLLKPFSFERFLKAVDKATTKKKSEVEEDSFISIKADGKLYRIGFDEILFVEGKGDYLTVHTNTRKLTFNQTMKSFLEQLPSSSFSRIHKSYIVSLPKVEYLEGNMASIDGKKLPIGNTYKESFIGKFSG